MARGRQIGAARNVHVRCGDFLGNVAVFCGQGAVDSASRTGLPCHNGAARAALGCQMGGSGETFGLVSGRRRFAWAIPNPCARQSRPKFPTEISRGPRFEMRSAELLAALDKEQGAERARRTLVRRSERSDAVTQRCAQSGGSRPVGAVANGLAAGFCGFFGGGRRGIGERQIDDLHAP